MTEINEWRRVIIHCLNNVNTMQLRTVVLTNIWTFVKILCILCENVTYVCSSRLIEELKQQNPDFPDVTSGIYVHEVVPHSPAQK